MFTIYFREYVSKIRKNIINHNLPIHIIFNLGQELKNIFCSSRPYKKNIVLALDAIFVPIFVITVTVKCWDVCTK